MNLSPSNLDLVFAALGDPTRRAILEQLARGSATVSDLAEPFDMALPTVMAHLRKLENAGLVTSIKDGRVRTCAINPDAFAPVADWLTIQRQIWETRLDRFDAYVLTLMKDRANET